MPGTTVTPDLVAKALAPQIRLHSQDPHQPCSVEWFLNRCSVVEGSATLQAGGITVPPGLTVTVAGPLTPDTLVGASSSSSFGGGGIDNISLFPLVAVPGSQPVLDWGWPSLLSGYFTDIDAPAPSPGTVAVPNPHFFSYQLETFLGQHTPPRSTCTAPIYCRITTRQDYYLISYFGFFPYNGGLGPQTAYSAKPLDTGSGFGAHIGDWVRLTAKVTIINDLVSLHYVDYEAHGDQSLSTSANFTNLPLAQVPKLTAYCAWHSHELYPTAGTHLRVETGFTANDYTDDFGIVWETRQNLTFISDTSPSWVKYNGLWGANMTLPGTVQNYLKNGPEGPAFHWYWISETKDGRSPVRQWSMTENPPLSAPTGLEWHPNPSGQMFTAGRRSLRWEPVAGATSYVVAFNRYGITKFQQEQSSTSCRWPWTQGDMYTFLSMTVTALGVDRPPSPPVQSSAFFANDGMG